MKITIKTLQNKQYDFEINPDDLVALIQVKILKEKIAKDLGFEIELQKLILYGKVLEDNKKLSEYKVNENDFMVLMVSKVIIRRKKK